jgi:8-oxo-dGTP pyrophosphatase MutT (NUDIX family)
VPDLSLIRERLAGFEPELIDADGLHRAAVALVLREHAQRCEVLFIERSTRADDPWSGHMAFPGGRVEPGDPDTRAAAERETFEEVGVSLEGADYLGRLGDIQGSPRLRQNRLVVTAHIYHVREPTPFRIDSREVASALWFPVRGILDPSRHVAYRSAHVREVDFPGILVGEPDRHVVWGLTYRFVDIFMSAIAHPLPDRWDPIHQARYRAAT